MLGVTDMGLKLLFLNAQIVSFFYWVTPSYYPLLLIAFKRTVSLEKFSIVISELWIDADWNAWQNKFQLISTQDVKYKSFPPRIPISVRPLLTIKLNFFVTLSL